VETKVELIPIEKIEEPKEALRSYITKEGLEELKESIDREGLLQPLLVRPLEDKYEIVAGHRRFLAIKELGWTEVPCIVKEMDDTETLVKRIHENIKREDIDPVDLAELIHKLYEQGGYTFKQIGEMFGKSESWARDVERIYFCDDFIKEALRAGHIKRSHAYILMKHPDPERRYYFLSQSLKSFRAFQDNKEVGGSPNSAHLRVAIP